MAAHTDITLRYSQLQARSHLKLFLNDIYARGHLCHRVLDLQSGVHLEEVEIAFRRQHEFHRSGTDVIHCLGCRHRCVPHGLAQLMIHGRGRGFLDHLLVPALQRAVPLVEVDAISMGVGENLQLHVPCAGE